MAQASGLRLLVVGLCYQLEEAGSSWLELQVPAWTRGERSQKFAANLEILLKAKDWALEMASIYLVSSSGHVHVTSGCPYKLIQQDWYWY